MKRLFSSGPTDPDIRPALLSMSALMMILLPTILLVTTPQKLIGISLSMAGTTTEIPPAPPGPIESLRLEVLPDGFLLEAKVRKTDVLASVGDTEVKTWTVKTWKEAIDQLESIKKLDPERKRILLHPDPKSTTKQVIHWMDTLQRGDLFSEVIIESVE